MENAIAETERRRLPSFDCPNPKCTAKNLVFAASTEARNRAKLVPLDAVPAQVSIEFIVCCPKCRQQFAMVRVIRAPLIPFEVIPTEIGKVVFEYRAERSPCALCAKLRRGALNTAAKERGCNKVALGHNREDVLETFLMSMLYEGRMNTFAPITYLSRKDITVIRPMIYVPEKYCLSVAKQLELPVLPPNCDIAGKTKREEAKELIKYLCTIVPDADVKMMHAITNTEKYGLWDRMRLKQAMGENTTSEDGE